VRPLPSARRAWPRRIGGGSVRLDQASRKTEAKGRIIIIARQRLEPSANDIKDFAAAGTSLSLGVQGTMADKRQTTADMAGRRQHATELLLIVGCLPFCAA